MARLDLGLCRDEFHAITLRELGALMKRRADLDRDDDYRAGIVAALLYNANRGQSSPAKQPHDFFPSLRPRFLSRRQTGEDQLKLLCTMAGITYPPPPRKAPADG